MTTPAPTVQSHNCSDGEFVCVVHGECVASSKVCDFRQDCSDGSDEINCGKTFIFSSLTFHCIILSFTMLLPVFQLMFPVLLYLFTFLSLQWGNNVILKAVIFVVGRASTPLWSQATHFAGHLTKGRAFILKSSTTVLLMTTPCEYQQNNLYCSNISKEKPINQLVDWQKMYFTTKTFSSDEDFMLVNWISLDFYVILGSWTL